MCWIVCSASRFCLRLSIGCLPSFLGSFVRLAVYSSVRPSVFLPPARLVCHIRLLLLSLVRSVLTRPAPSLPDPLRPVPRRPRQLEPRPAPRPFASAPPMLPDPPPPPHIPCARPPCVGGTCKFLKIMCVVKRALLYSPPAETRLTVYRRSDILVQYQSDGSQAGDFSDFWSFLLSIQL